MAEMRRCIGSARFGIEAHDAPPEDFPAQPSQKDGLGRMCRPHWRQYTAGLAREAKARNGAAASTTPEPTEAEVVAPPAIEETRATGGETASSPKVVRIRPRRRAVEQEPGSQGDAG